MKHNQYKNEISKKSNKISIEGISLSKKEINRIVSKNNINQDQKE